MEKLKRSEIDQSNLRFVVTIGNMKVPQAIFLLYTDAVKYVKKMQQETGWDWNVFEQVNDSFDAELNQGL